ncbi:hypothetical protein [Neisseria sicca]|jgi:hypothetical protein|uniref:hypothetical protein n=1 Tax=Neisseria sicca TaxID=490 RepID=UPI001F0C3E6A|nr:hypothetical protein [Neisseria sicca]
MGFFSELHDDLVQVKKKIAQADESMLSEQEREQYELITAVASSMIDNPELWEEQCLFNIHYIGENFKSLIQNFLFDFSDKNLSYLYDDVVRFLAELNLSFQQKEYSFNPGSSLFPIIKRLKEQMFYSGERHPDSLNYAFYKMPIDILCFYMGNQGFKTFFEFDERKNALETSITKYWDEIQQKIDEVNVLKDKLDEYKTAFNFVGLSKGFESLLEQKNEAKKKTFGLLVLLAITVALTLAISFSVQTTGAVFSWQSMLPIIGLEFVLIYFFRVVLTHYHSIQTQIMQLELRQSLCQFIQNYAEYAKKIKTDDKDALEKFENLIFSSILSNPDKVPGTFDGVEGLTSLLKELKK